MAWYEQLDLDFGNITDQFTDLIGEASTLLENANNLEILNLDAMAIQEELEEELAVDELEYEDENEEDGVVHHDRAIIEEYVPEVVHHYDTNDPVPVHQHSDTASLDCHTHHDVSSPERHTFHSRASSAPAFTVKQLHFDQLDQSIDEEPTTESDQVDNVSESQPLDDSFAWDAMDDKTPKKSTKLSSHIRNENAGNTTTVEDVNAKNANTLGHESVKNATFTIEDTGRAPLTVPIASATKTKPPQSSAVAAANTTSTGGRKARPLKPKPKVSKEFDFWGVNSKKKTLTFDVLNKNKNNTSHIHSGSNAAVTDGTQAIDTTSGSDVANSIVDTTNTVSEHFYGVVGLFGDDFVTDNSEPDIESNTLMTTSSAASRDSAGSIDKATATTTNTTASSAAHRLPLGWLSDIYSTTTSAPVESFFDHLEEEEDPILRQVELNKTNPYNSVSNVDRLWNMWESMVGKEDVPSNHTNYDSNSSADASTSNNNTASIFVPVITPGTGPNWVVTSLNGVYYITGVTIMVLSASGNVVYSGDVASTPNNIYPHWNVFTVKLVQPVDYQYKSVILFSLRLVRMLIIILLSVVIRLVVFICKLLGICFTYCVAYLRTTRIGTRVSNGRARLRQFFTNERVDRILGSEPPSDLTWQQRYTETARSFLHASYEQMNSTNGVLLLTAVLFLFSYFKFQRYGTDAGD